MSGSSPIGVKGDLVEPLSETSDGASIETFDRAEGNARGDGYGQEYGGKKTF